MNDIPDWAGKRACELLNAEEPLHPYLWPSDGVTVAVAALVKLVMQLEQPPIDPDEEAVKRIFAAFYGDSSNHGTYLPPEMLARAVSQYKQEKANG
ncbi:hypothetical protein SAMN05660666_02530 [Novosphingobium aromaticivorans]|uniref:hypothetical protein n=1 Tax=Novosphingobium aromaticivorans TaxID=48935 RepID=UPI00003C80B8|nr:hypothetical protein [Novosphingobium aromaticivorans]SCY69731.1 hypothetical protein SAMN05660666_02530 [Novosphingobium aromaticivorans]